MRKAVMILSVLLVVFFVGGIAAAVYVNAPREDVVLTEMNAYGDRSAADGLQIGLNTEVDNQMHWYTDYSLTDETIRTEFKFYQSRHNVRYEQAYQGVELESSFHYGYGLYDKNPTGIAKAYQELYDSIEPGEEARATIRVADYHDFYPIGFHIHLPGNSFWYDYGEEIGQHTSEDELALIRKFTEFFRIPVLPEERLEIHVSKYANGAMSSSSGSVTEAIGYGGDKNYDSFYLYTHSVASSDAAYFTFSPETHMGNLIDTSLIPGGYGIYRLPYTMEKNRAVTNADELTMAYALDLQERVIEMELDDAQEKLFLHTRVEYTYYLTIIDLATMEQLQRIELLSSMEDAYFTHYKGDDFFAYVLADMLIVVARQEDGSYCLEFSVPYQRPETIYAYGLEYNSALDYDGEKLAVLKLITRENGSYPETSAFNLSVYDASGIIYYGDYYSSLNLPYEHGDYQFICRPGDPIPLEVYWM